MIEVADAIKKSNNSGLARSVEVIAAANAMSLISLSNEFISLVESGKLGKLKRTPQIDSMTNDPKSSDFESHVIRARSAQLNID